jgi:hypothetical protein
MKRWIGVGLFVVAVAVGAFLVGHEGGAGAAGASRNAKVIGFARIDAQGHYINGKHVTSYEYANATPRVTFDRDVSQCALSATAEWGPNNGTPANAHALLSQPNTVDIYVASLMGVDLVVVC